MITSMQTFRRHLLNLQNEKAKLEEELTDAQLNISKAASVHAALTYIQQT